MKKFGEREGEGKYRIRITKISHHFRGIEVVISLGNLEWCFSNLKYFRLEKRERKSKKKKKDIKRDTNLIFMTENQRIMF